MPLPQRRQPPLRGTIVAELGCAAESYMSVQRWELGHSVPRPTHQSGLVEALGLSPDEFFTAREGEPAVPGDTVAV